MSLDGEFYVCLTCLNQIKKKKKPKRNDREILQYYDFPAEHFREIKEKCSSETRLQNEMVLNKNLRVSSELTEEHRLNRLEQFIFKNPIPFIRIANCKMGRYLKVQGNLILISTDIESSMTKILPHYQKIIPVSLKRKLSYKGFYMEEWVDVEKVELYFNWFKANNTFFEDITLDKERISEFEENVIQNMQEYKKEPENYIDDEIEKNKSI